MYEFPVVGIDADLTILDTSAPNDYAFTKGFQHRGYLVDKVDPKIGVPLNQRVMEILVKDLHVDILTAVGQTPKVVESISQEYLRVLPEKARFYPGSVEKILAWRRKGYKVGVTTNSTRPPLEIYNGILQRDYGLSFSDLFDETVTIEDVEKPKPASDQLVELSRRLKSENLLYIGDHPFDMIAARNSNSPAIGVLTGKKSEIELLRTGALYVYPSLANLPDELYVQDDWKELIERRSDLEGTVCLGYNPLNSNFLPVARDRVSAALGHYRETYKRGNLLILAGGDTDGVLTEAMWFKLLALQQIPDYFYPTFILEEMSTDTKSNLEYVRELAKQYHIKSLAIVTSPDHIKTVESHISLFQAPSIPVQINIRPSSMPYVRQDWQNFLSKSGTQ